ncbi:MAG: thermonuclease family protein [Alphaproteobacteria bacterium]|nr:thermonuclease family protein [Alphaproteobacteria bacterium]
MIRSIFVSLFVFVASIAQAAEPIVGNASVIDGDTLEIRGTRIRFNGVDAPESAQLCLKDGSPWRCGQSAALALSDFIGRRAVTCNVVTTDKYGRSVARCSVGGEDIQGWLARQGWAVAYRQYSRDYVPDEAAAHAAKAGIWASEFEMPWDWRKHKVRGSQKLIAVDIPASKADLAPTVTTSSGNCLIKGNVKTKGERIYHVPGSGSYDVTRIDTSKGEWMFCSVVEAEAAGWRRPR